jgi:putative Ca2+/H+ antiporter (TMEM165/GDT1 family)
MFRRAAIYFSWRTYSFAMDWKTLVSTFGAVFVAELGDKTQLATLSMSAGTRAKWAVFAGSALALVATSAIAVLAGTAVSRYVSPQWLRRIAGAVFIALGVLFLVRPGE